MSRPHPPSRLHPSQSSMLPIFNQAIVWSHHKYWNSLKNTERAEEAYSCCPRLGMVLSNWKAPAIRRQLQMGFLLPSRQTNEGNTALIRMSSFPATYLVYLVQFPFPELYRRLVLLSRRLRFEAKDSVLREMWEFEQKAICCDAGKWTSLFLSWVSCDVTGREIRLRELY